VQVDNPTPGVWQVRVSPTTVPDGPQAYSLVPFQATVDLYINSTADTSDGCPGDGICAAGTCAAPASITCTLRAAIEEANALAGADTINFNIPGAAPHTILPNPSLPTIIETVTISGTTQPGYVGTPIIVLDGSTAGAGANGLVIQTSNTIVTGLVIQRFQAGVRIEASPVLTLPANSNVVRDNYIGTDVNGTLDRGNDDVGVYIVGLVDNADLNLIEDNLISGNGASGVFILGGLADRNTVSAATRSAPTSTAPPPSLTTAAAS